MFIVLFIFFTHTNEWEIGKNWLKRDWHSIIVLNLVKFLEWEKLKEPSLRAAIRLTF